MPSLLHPTHHTTITHTLHSHPPSLSFIITSIQPSAFPNSLLRFALLQQISPHSAFSLPCHNPIYPADWPSNRPQLQLSASADTTPMGHTCTISPLMQGKRWVEQKGRWALGGPEVVFSFYIHDHDGIQERLYDDDNTVPHANTDSDLASCRTPT